MSKENRPCFLRRILRVNPLLLGGVALLAVGCGGGSGNADDTAGGKNRDDFIPSLPSDGKYHSDLQTEWMRQRSFSSGGETYVAMDFQSMDLNWTFDNDRDETTGKAAIAFQVHEEGLPYFLLEGEILSASLNGKDITTAEVSDPDRKNDLIALNEELVPGKDYLLQLTYRMNNSEVSYRDSGIGFVTSMADITNGNYFESYGPANFEDDQFQMNLTAKIIGASEEHKVFTNGKISQNGDYEWQIQFPAYYTSSSFYFHLTNTNLHVRNSEYKGVARTIPITVYSQTASAVNTATERLQRYFAELEADYGPYMHDSFVAYISGSGGMEHNGATITSLSALGHELIHSWFGRGVMPIGGNAGWIDEAAASWRDNGYRRSSGRQRSPTDMANYSIFNRFAPYNVYADGNALYADLDALFAEKFGGLRPVLKQFYAQWRGKVVDTATFQRSLEELTGENIAPYFERYVYGRSTELGGVLPDESSSEEELIDEFYSEDSSMSPYPESSEDSYPDPYQDQSDPAVEGDAPVSHHPPALTPEEVELLR